MSALEKNLIFSKILTKMAKNLLMIQNIVEYCGFEHKYPC